MFVWAIQQPVTERSKWDAQLHHRERLMSARHSSFSMGIIGCCCCGCSDWSRSLGWWWRWRWWRWWFNGWWMAVLEWPEWSALDIRIAYCVDIIGIMHPHLFVWISTLKGHSSRLAFVFIPVLFVFELHSQLGSQCALPWWCRVSGDCLIIMVQQWHLKWP